jgi:C4-dicarboxylate transporter DctM subunit
MESGAAIILLAPILAPIAHKLGVDPLHFGFVMVLNLAIGMATPVGVCLFVSCGITGLSLEVISKNAMKFIGAEIAVLLIVTYIERYRCGSRSYWVFRGEGQLGFDHKISG